MTIMSAGRFPTFADAAALSYASAFCESWRSFAVGVVTDPSCGRSPSTSFN